MTLGDLSEEGMSKQTGPSFNKQEGRFLGKGTARVRTLRMGRAGHWRSSRTLVSRRQGEMPCGFYLKHGRKPRGRTAVVSGPSKGWGQ